MTNEIQFSYILGDDNELTVTATITPGYPARINCLPEDAYPAESDDVEITSVKFAGSVFTIEGIIVNAYVNSVTGKLHREMLEDALEAAAFEEWREQGS